MFTSTKSTKFAHFCLISCHSFLALLLFCDYYYAYSFIDHDSIIDKRLLTSCTYLFCCFAINDLCIGRLNDSHALEIETHSCLTMGFFKFNNSLKRFIDLFYSFSTDAFWAYWAPFNAKVFYRWFIFVFTNSLAIRRVGAGVYWN